MESISPSVELRRRRIEGKFPGELKVWLSHWRCLINACQITYRPAWNGHWNGHSLAAKRDAVREEAALTLNDISFILSAGYNVLPSGAAHSEYVPLEQDFHSDIAAAQARAERARDELLPSRRINAAGMRRLFAELIAANEDALLALHEMWKLRLVHEIGSNHARTIVDGVAEQGKDEAARLSQLIISYEEGLGTISAWGLKNAKERRAAELAANVLAADLDPDFPVPHQETYELNDFARCLGISYDIVRRWERERKKQELRKKYPRITEKELDSRCDAQGTKRLLSQDHAKDLYRILKDKSTPGKRGFPDSLRNKSRGNPEV